MHNFYRFTLIHRLFKFFSLSLLVVCVFSNESNCVWFIDSLNDLCGSALGFLIWIFVVLDMDLCGSRYGSLWFSIWIFVVLDMDLFVVLDMDLCGS